MSLGQTALACGRLLGTNEIFIADSVVTAEEQAILVRWTEEQRQRGRLLVNPRDPEIHMTPFFSADGGLTRITKSGLGPDGIERRAQKGLIWVPKIDEQFMDPVPEAFWTIRNRVKDLLGLGGLEEDYYKGSFLTCMSPGGRVHEHRDARVRVAEEERLILRCNVLFKRPQQGGMPVIGSQEIDICDRGMWAFYPTEFRHSTTVVRGPDSRGNLSFGFLVRPAYLWQRRFRIAPGAVSVDLAVFAHNATIERRVSPGLRERHLAVWQFVMSTTGDFSVDEAARTLEQDPSEISEALRDLQEWRLVQSLSSRRGAGTVLLFREVLVCGSGEA
jgi:hypothetical protein